MRQISTSSEEADQIFLLTEVKCFLENLAQDLEGEICTHLLAENVKVAERLNKHLVGTHKLLSVLKN